MTMLKPPHRIIAIIVTVKRGTDLRGLTIGGTAWDGAWLDG